MINQLQIKNYAIIDHIEVDFKSDLNIITGETGAGKSILMGALSLILGARADTSVLKSDTEKCVVEAAFLLDGHKEVEAFLTTHALDQPGELIIRREIAASGKSRAFINDTPVTLQQLKELSVLLVDQHQQFDTLQLSDSDFQRKVVDALAGNKTLLTSYQQVFRQLQSSKTKLHQLESEKTLFDKEADFNQYQYDELAEHEFQENELEDLEAELNLLSNAEEIKSALVTSSEALQGGENPLVQSLKQVSSRLESYRDYHEEIGQLADRLKSAQIEVQDIAQEVERLSDGFSLDQERMQVVNDRMDIGYKLCKKHGVDTTAGLLEVRATLHAKLNAVLDTQTQIEILEKEVAEMTKKGMDQAEALSDKRLAQVKTIEAAVNKKLNRVGMPNARIKVRIEKDTILNAYGNNRIEFLFDANKSNRFESIGKVASGGELSRLMLCIKSLVAQTVELPTLIFDEIDTGISGEAAKQVGVIMKELAEKIQVIAITHQPQIAAKAAHHLYVYKQKATGANNIRTGIRALDTTERIQTIAQMLGGENPTSAALESAREMMAE